MIETVKIVVKKNETPISTIRQDLLVTGNIETRELALQHYDVID